MSENPDKPIPREFDSEYEERPFQCCSRCGEKLSAFDNFQINKAFRNAECVFEYAFCSQCRDALLEEFSEESKANLERHQRENMHNVSGTAECCFCGTSREKTPMRDFTMTALCRGTSLLDSIMICGKCQEGMQELLSQHTKDVRRRFFESLPGVPPDWEPEPFTEESPNLKPAISKPGPPLIKPELVSQGGDPTGRAKEVPSDDCGTELVWAWRHP
jgi:hypothetical protein